MLLRPTAVYRRLRNRVQPSPANDSAAYRAADHFPIGPIQQATRPAGGRRSQTVILNTSQGRFVLKAYPPSLGASAIEFEHNLLLFVAQSDFPAPRLIPTAAQDTWIEVEDRHYACFEFIEGRRYVDFFLLPSKRRRLVTQAAQMLARYHQLATRCPSAGKKTDGFRPGTHVRWHDSVWYLNEMDACRDAVAEHPQGQTLIDRWDDMRARLEHLWTKVEGPDSTPLPSLAIHGDYGPYNLLYQNGRLKAVLDFECAHLDWRLTEILSATVRFSETRSGHLNAARARHFLQVYHAAASLTSEEVVSASQLFALGRLRNAIKALIRFRKTAKPSHLGTVHKMLAWADQAEMWQRLLTEVVP